MRNNFHIFMPSLFFIFSCQALQELLPSSPPPSSSSPPPRPSTSCLPPPTWLSSSIITNDNFQHSLDRLLLPPPVWLRRSTPQVWTQLQAVDHTLECEKIMLRAKKYPPWQLPWLSPTAMAGMDGQTVILWRSPLLPTTACCKVDQIYDRIVFCFDFVNHE